MLTGKAEYTNETSVNNRNKNNNNNNNDMNNTVVMVEDDEDEEKKAREAKKRQEKEKRRKEKEAESEAADDEAEEEKKEDKQEKKNNRVCVFCKGKRHTEMFCWRPLLAPPGSKEKEKEALIQKYEWARKVVQATEKKQYFKPIKEAIEDEEERLRKREKNKNLKCPNCKRWGHTLKSCWLADPAKAPGWWDAKIALRQKEEWEESETRYRKKTGEERKTKQRVIQLIL